MPDGGGFVLLDSNWRLISADEEALACLAPRDPDTGHADPGMAVREFAAEVSRTVEHGSSSQSFDYHGLCWRALRFSCLHNGKMEWMNAVLVGPLGGSFSFVASFSRMFRLTPRETETMALCLRGLSAKEIAQELGIGVSTAKSFLRMISVKMGASSRAEVMSKLMAHMCEVSLTCPFRKECQKH